MEDNMAGTLIILKPNGEDGSRYPVIQQKLLIGSDPACHVRIRNDSVKNIHCSLTHDGVYTALENFAVFNPVSVNDQEVVHHKQLQSGDIIKVGNRKLRWETNKNKTSVAPLTPLKKILSRHSLNVSTVPTKIPQLSATSRMLQTPLKKENATPARRGSISGNDVEILKHSETPGKRRSRSATLDSPLKSCLKTPKQITKTPRRSSLLPRDSLPQIEEHTEDYQKRVSDIKEEMQSGDPDRSASATKTPALKSNQKSVKSKIPVPASTKVNASSSKQTPKSPYKKVAAQSDLSEMYQTSQKTPLPTEHTSARLSPNEKNVGDNSVMLPMRSSKRKLSMSTEKSCKKFKVDEENQSLMCVGYQFSSMTVPKSFNFNKTSEASSSPATEYVASSRRSMRHSSQESSSISSSSPLGTSTTDSYKESSPEKSLRIDPKLLKKNPGKNNGGVGNNSYLQNLSLISDDDDYENIYKNASSSETEVDTFSSDMQTSTQKSSQDDYSESKMQASISDFIPQIYSDAENNTPKSDLIDFASEDDSDRKSSQSLNVSETVEDADKSERRWSSRSGLKKSLNVSKTESPNTSRSSRSVGKKIAPEEYSSSNSSPLGSAKKVQKTPINRVTSRRSSTLDISGIASLYSTPTSEIPAADDFGQNSAKRSESPRRTPIGKSTVSALRRMVAVKSLLATPETSRASEALEYSEAIERPSSRKSNRICKSSPLLLSPYQAPQKFTPKRSARKTHLDQSEPDSSSVNSDFSASHLAKGVTPKTPLSALKNTSFKSSRKSKPAENCFSSDNEDDTARADEDLFISQTPQSEMKNTSARSSSKRKRIEKSFKNKNEAETSNIDVNLSISKTPRSAVKNTTIESSRKSKPAENSFSSDNEDDNARADEDLFVSQTPQSEMKNTSVRLSSKRKRIEKSFKNENKAEISNIDANLSISKTPRSAMKNTTTKSSRKSKTAENSFSSDNEDDTARADEDLFVSQTPQSEMKNTSVRSSSKRKQIEKSFKNENEAEISNIDVNLSISKTPRSAMKNTTIKSSRKSNPAENSFSSDNEDDTARADEDLFVSQTPQSEMKNTSVRSSNKHKRTAKSFANESKAETSSTDVNLSNFNTPLSAMKNTSIRSARKSKFGENSFDLNTQPKTSNINADLDVLQNPQSAMKTGTRGSSRKSKPLERSIAATSISQTSSPIPKNVNRSATRNSSTDSSTALDSSSFASSEGSHPFKDNAAIYTNRSIRTSPRKRQLEPSQDDHENSEISHPARELKSILKTPKRNYPTGVDVSGVKSLLRTPRIQKEPNNDLSEVPGVKSLFRTPRIQKEPNNDLSEVPGVKSLFRTPRIQKEPNNDLSEVPGVRSLLRTPKIQKEPNNDLSEVPGVKSLFRTPRIQKEPNNDLSEVPGVKSLLRTPKIQKEPNNDLSEVSGVKSLLRTPKHQRETKNDLTNIPSFKQLYAHEKASLKSKADISIGNIFEEEHERVQKDNSLFDSLRNGSPLRTYSNKKKSFLNVSTPTPGRAAKQKLSLSPRIEEWVQEATHMTVDPEFLENSFNMKSSAKRNSKRSMTPSVDLATNTRGNKSSSKLGITEQEHESPFVVLEYNPATPRRSSRTPKRNKKYEDEVDILSDDRKCPLSLKKVEEEIVKPRTTRSTRNTKKAAEDDNDKEKKVPVKNPKSDKQVEVMESAEELTSNDESKTVEIPRASRRRKRSLDESNNKKEQNEVEKTNKRAKFPVVVLERAFSGKDTISPKTTRRGTKVVTVVKSNTNGSETDIITTRGTRRGKKITSETEESDHDVIITQRCTRRVKKEISEMPAPKRNLRGKKEPQPTPDGGKVTNNTETTQGHKTATEEKSQEEIEAKPALRSRRSVKKPLVTDEQLTEEKSLKTRTSGRNKKDVNANKENEFSDVSEISEKPATRRNARRGKQEEVLQENATVEEKITKKRNTRAKEEEEMSDKKPAVKTRRLMSTKDSEDICFQQLEVDLPSTRTTRATRRQVALVGQEKKVVRKTTRKR